MGTLNADGLYQKYGTERAIVGKGGEYHTVGALREIEMKIDLTALTSSPVIIDDNTFFPKMRIESIICEVQTGAASSGSGTFDFGLIQTDRATEIDYNGFIAAEVAGTLDTAGKRVTYITGTSKAGALIGTTTTNVGYLCANYNTAVFQTGLVYVRIQYRPN